jgi:hypothetical protein
LKPLGYAQKSASEAAWNTAKVLGRVESPYASSLLYPNFTDPENPLFYRILVEFSAKFPEHFPKATLYVSLDQILPPSSLSKENVYIFPTVSDRNLGAAIPFP